MVLTTVHMNKAIHIRISYSVRSFYHFIYLVIHLRLPVLLKMRLIDMVRSKALGCLGHESSTRTFMFRVVSSLCYCVISSHLVRLAVRISNRNRIEERVVFTHNDDVGL